MPFVANPPISSIWSSDKKFMDDERFMPMEKAGTMSKEDFAFVQLMIYHLDEKGTMAIVSTNRSIV
jgi:type I restriction enzyme M protein